MILQKSFWYAVLLSLLEIVVLLNFISINENVLYSFSLLYNSDYIVMHVVFIVITVTVIFQ